MCPREGAPPALEEGNVAEPPTVGAPGVLEAHRGGQAFLDRREALHLSLDLESLGHQALGLEAPLHACLIVGEARDLPRLLPLVDVEGDHAETAAGARARAARSMMASEAQRWAVTMSGAKRWYSSRSASASMKSTFPTWACSARRRASLIAAGSLSRPTTCRARAASQKVSRPVPQPTSSPRIAPRPSASSSPRNLGEMGKLLGLEVLRLWVMEDEGRHGGLRVHHEPFRQLEANLRRLEEIEEDALVGEVRTGGIAEGDPDASVARLEPVLHGQPGRIGKAPLGAQPRVEHLRESFGQLDGEGLDGMGAQILPF